MWHLNIKVWQENTKIRFKTIKLLCWHSLSMFTSHLDWGQWFYSQDMIALTLNRTVSSFLNLQYCTH